jgi:hypothetical protein
VLALGVRSMALEGSMIESEPTFFKQKYVQYGQNCDSPKHIRKNNPAPFPGAYLSTSSSQNACCSLRH